MAGPFSPNTRLKKSNPIDQFMAGIIPGQNTVMAQGLPPEDQANDMVVAPTGAQPEPTQVQSSPVPATQNQRMKKQLNDLMGGKATSASVSESGDERLEAPIRSEINRLSGESEKYRQQFLGQQQESLDAMQKDVQDYENAKVGIDWRPLAAMLDGWQGGGNLYKLASDLAPESPEVKRAKLNTMKQQLMAAKGSMSKEQHAALKEQLDAQLGMLKEIGAEKRIQASMNAKDRSQDSLEDRFIKKQTNDYAKVVGDRLKMLNNFNPIEQSLGFSLEDYDDIKGSVNGKNVDAPGIKIPGLQAIYAATPEGERFRTRFDALLNDTLRAYSGAAVTDSEAAKTLKRFAVNPGAVRQSSFVGALKDFKKLLKEEIRDKGAGYDEEVLYSFERNYLNADKRGALSKPGTAPKAAAPKAAAPKSSAPSDDDINNMTPEQLKQYLSQDG